MADAPPLHITLAASSMSSLVSRVACHPLDTIKSKMQATSRGSVATCISDTLAKEGMRGFYRGLGAATIIGVPAGALYFTSYEAFKRRLGDGPASHLLAGVGAEAVACVVFVPVDVVKERCQVHSYTSSYQCFRTVLKKEGPRALYRGYGPTLYSFGAFSGLYWAFYEQLRPSGTVSFADALPCALGAGALASWLTAPLDLAKLRVQVHRGADGPSFLRALVDASRRARAGCFAARARASCLVRRAWARRWRASSRRRVSFCNVVVFVHSRPRRASAVGNPFCELALALLDRKLAAVAT